MSNLQQRFLNHCQVLANDAYLQYCKQISPVMYLYGFKGGDQFNGLKGYTELVLARDKPQFFEMVILTHVPRDLTVPQLTAWFHDNLRREPILDALPQEVAK